MGGGFPLYTKNLYIFPRQAPVVDFWLQAIIDLRSRLFTISPMKIGSICIVKVGFFVFRSKNEEKDWKNGCCRPESAGLNEQVKRNIERFPGDFCFQLDKAEFEELVANCDRFKTLKHSSSRSFAFTEQGVAMLSSALKSESAIRVNIAIMRAFVQLRHIMMGNGGLVSRLSSNTFDDAEEK